MRKAFAAAVDWDPSLTLSINISPRQFTDSWLAQKIVRLLAESGFPAERLVVEVTESSLFADIDLARTIVQSLKNQGIALALDDFGSGFSSLSHLSALPFDKIKIDRSFVASIGKDRQSAAIVRAVTTMAQALDVPVVAEGIEDAAAHETLLQMGCASGQGWYFGKPIAGRGCPAHAAPAPRRAARATSPRAERQARLSRRALSRRGTGGSDRAARRVARMVKTTLSITPCRRVADLCPLPLRRSAGAQSFVPGDAPRAAIGCPTMRACSR